ncbi:hypothetical protein BGW42_004145 [Actinomortierella wolfii]|nr:hypothetical protein BGW42_004145 [Actinomortierella wolfii]
MAQVKSSIFLNHTPLRSGTGRSTIGPRPPPKFGVSNKKPNNQTILQNAFSSSSPMSSSTSTSPTLSNSSNTLDSTIRNLRLADRPTPRTPSPILESMGEPRTPLNEPIMESMGDDGIMAPPPMIHAPQPHYYNTVSGPLGYQVQHGPLPSWPNHGYATMNAPPAGYGTVGSHHGHALPYLQQQNPPQQTYYQHQHQQPWPQDQYQQHPPQQQQQQNYHEYIQQQNIATAAAHGYQLVSPAPIAPVASHPSMPVAATPTTAITAPHHANTPQTIPPIPPVDIPQFRSYFPPKTELDPSSEEVDNPSPQPTPTKVIPPPEHRQRPPSPRITIPASQPPASAAVQTPSSSQSSARSPAHSITSASLPSASSFTQEKPHAQPSPSTQSPRSSTPTSGIAKLGDRLASFSSNKSSTGTTSRLAELTTLSSSSVRAKSAKFNAMATISPTTESPATHTQSASVKGSPKTSSPSPSSTSMVVDMPKEPPISPPGTSPSEASPLEPATSMYSTPAKAASTTSLDAAVAPIATVPPTSTKATTPTATTATTTTPAETTTTSAASELPEADKSGLGSRPNSTRNSAQPAQHTARRPVSTAGPPVPPPRGGTYDWRSEWAERRKSTPVSPYSPSFNALRKLNMDKELPPIRTEEPRHRQEQDAPIRKLTPKLEPNVQSNNPSKANVPSNSTSSSPVTPAATLPVAEARVSTPRTATPPLNTDSKIANEACTAAPRQETPSPPPSSLRTATPPVPTTTHLRVPTPPAQAPTEKAQSREERRAYNLSDYIYYDHDHDSKCIIGDSIEDSYPTTSAPSAKGSTTTLAVGVSDESGKTPLEHSQVDVGVQGGTTHGRGNSINGSKKDHQQQKWTTAESNFLCAGCDEPISGMMVTAMGKRWHVDHFICVECGQNLEHVQFFQRDGHPYCHYDYHEKFSPRCAHCDTAIENECLTALGKDWHPDHFFCRACGDPFGEDGYMIHEDRPYCEKDYLNLFAPKCASCQGPIQGDFINALKRKWHRDCFGCTVCHIGFDHSSYFVRDGEPYCEAHYKAAKAAAK